MRRAGEGEKVLCSKGGGLMVGARIWKPQRLLFMLLVLVFIQGGATAQAQPAAGKAKVDRLVMGLILPYRDYWRPWINGTPDHMIQHDPAFEWLFEVSPEGKYKHWLDESWEMAQDGMSWHLKLHKGVPFQHGYGEFTAKDVVHNHALWCDDHYPGRHDPPFSGYRNGMCMVHRIEVINDHELVMYCKNVCLDVLFYYSSASNMPMFSKAQWDKEGEMGYETHPAGTGPYVVKERQMTWTIEEPTRYAQVLAGETHLTEINKDLVDAAVRKGYKMIASRGTAQQIDLIFGGLYFGTEDPKTGRYTEHGGTNGKLDPTVPWTKKEVRQAMNKAINRDEIFKVIYKGRATPMYVHGYYPDLPGWDPTWAKRFSEMYGYDPAAAKRLLAHAGFPKGFKAKMWVFPFAGAPELISLVEAIHVQLRDVGIELEPEEADVVATVLPRSRDRKANWYMSPIIPSKKAVE